MPHATCNCETCQKCKHRIYMRGYFRRNPEKNRQRVRKYRETHLEEIRAADRDRGFRIYDVLKVKARRKANHAIATGKLVREPCERCGHGMSCTTSERREACHSHRGALGRVLGVEHQVYG